MKSKQHDLRVGRKYELIFEKYMKKKGYDLEDLNLKDKFSKMDFKLKDKNIYMELKSRSRSSSFFFKGNNDFMLEKTKFNYLIKNNKSAIIFYLLEDGLFYYKFKPATSLPDITIRLSKQTGRAEDKIKYIAYINRHKIKKFSNKIKYNEPDICLIG